jgi:chromosome segregation ATPase
MPGWIRNYIKVVIAACLIVSFCVAEGDAQTRRKKKRRRSVPAAPKPVITNPAIAPPDTGDVKIISTADSNKEASKESSDQNPGSKPKSADPNDQEKTQQTISDLSKQVDRLNNKLSSMQEDDRYQMDMERLTRAEQRAEQLRSQLMDIQAKIADFEARIEQLDWALRPENLDNSTAGYGSTHPETLREARKKQLESEKTRVQAQLKLAESSKSRLETAVSNADSEVDLLRAKLEQRRAQMDATPAETPAKPETKPRKPEN